MTQDNRDYGVESWAEETFGWEHVDNGHYDLVRDDGTEVEAKGCLRWVGDGRDRRRRGRFRMWKAEHDALVETGGMYLLAVYEHLDFEEPWKWDLFPADEVTDCIGHYMDNTYRPSKGKPAHLPWPKVFPQHVEGIQ